MTEELNILFVEDLPTDVELAKRALTKDGVVFKSRVVETEDDFLRELESDLPDIIICDFKMPRFSGMRALALRLAKYPNVPFVLLTSSINEEIAVECMKAGADDYILKDNLQRLIPAIRSAIAKKTVIREKQEALKELKESEEFKRRLIDSSNDCVKVLDLDGNLLSMNNGGQEQLEIDDITLYLNKSWVDFWKGKDKDAALEAILKAKNGETGKFSGFCETEKGTPKWWEIIVTPINDAFGYIEKLLAISRDITERKKAEDKLLQSEAKTRTILEAVSTGIMIIDQEKHIIVDVNPAAARLIGESREEIIGNICHNYVCPADEEKCPITDLSQTIDNSERILLNKDGKKIPILKTATKITIDEQILILESFTDITDLKKAEEEIYTSENRLRTLVQTIPDLVWLKDTEGTYLFCNKMIERLFGSKEADIIGKTDYDFFDRELADFLRENDNKAMANRGKNYNEEWMTFADDGHRALLETIKTPMYDDQGKLIGILGIGHDITSRKRAEESLTEKEKFLNTLLDAIPIPVFYKDKTGRYLGFNKAYETFFGTSRNELIGKTVFEISPPELAEIYNVKDMELLENGINQQYEFQIKTKHALIRDVIFNKAVFTDNSGKVNGLIGTILDITERKQNEEILRRSEATLDEALKIAKLGTWEYDVDSDKFKFNDQFYTLLGTTAEQEGGYIMSPMHYAQKFLHPDDMAMVGIETQKALETTDPNYYAHLDHRIIRADGDLAYITVNIRIAKDSQGRTIKTYGVNQDITERKKVDEILKINQKRFQDSQALGHVGNWEYNIQTQQFWGSDETKRIYGFDPSAMEFTADEVESCIPNRELVHKALVDLINEDKKYDLEFEIIPKDKSKRKIIHSVASLVRDSNGNAQKVTGLLTDITDRRKSEEGLKKLSRAVEQGPASVVITNQDGDIEYVNKKFCDVTGYSKEEVIGKNPRILKSNHHDDKFYFDFWDKILSGKAWQGEMLNKKKNGELFWESSLISSLVNDQGDITNFVAVKEDITERKRAAEEFIMLADALKSVDECVSITDLEDNVVFVNQSFLKTYGYSEDELIGKNIRIFRSPNNPPELIKEILPLTLRNGWHGELWNKRKDGSEFLISLTTKAIKSKDDVIFGLIGVARDITEDKRAETELIEAKEKAESSNKLKDAFIANMSHEIRTPLNGIIGLTSIIKETFAEHLEEKDEELFEGVHHSSNRIIRTIDMILNYSRLQTGQFPYTPKEIDLSTICTELIHQYKNIASKEGIDISFENKYGDVKLFADEYSITNSISNLVDNAIKYNNKGYVKLILDKGNNDVILLKIVDSGIGMDKEYIKHIFDPYLQEVMGYGRTYEGVGLGLALVKKFMDLNGADISIESKKWQGTTVTINFGKPIDQPKEKITEEIKTRIVIPLKKKDKPLVLIVEDDIINQEVTKRLIENKYNVICCDNFNEAIGLVKDNNVEMILMDISIKGKKNGLDLIKELKASKEYSQIPIIVVTAHAFDKDKDNAFAAGSDDYLSKPFSKDLLLEKMATFFPI